MIKLCFISFNSYPLFVKKSLGYFGGAEVQISQVAQALAKDRRFEVSLVVADYGQKPQLNFDRLRLYTGMKRRFFFQIELLRFLLTLKKINADIYFERTLNLKVGLVCLFCKLLRKKFIYMVAHDWDCQSGFHDYLKGFERFSFYFGLTRADLVICQTKQQQFRLKKNFGINAYLINSVIKAAPWQKQTKKEIILWIGRADKWKQPGKFIQLAEAFPKEKFVMVCRQGKDKQFNLKIKKWAKKLDNLTFLEAVSYDQINNYFQQAKIFVNTSIAEGFPNTFLQSGVCRTPIASLQVNPDQYITKHNCGMWAKKSFPKLVKDCKTLMKNKKLANDYGNNNYLYVKKFHSLKNVHLLARAIISIFGPSLKNLSNP